MDAAADTPNDNGSEQPQESTPAPTAAPSLTIIFKDTRGFEQSFKLKTTTQLGKAMDHFSAKVERPRDSLRFLFEGERVIPARTVLDLEMEDGDTIEVYEEQLGGDA